MTTNFNALLAINNNVKTKFETEVKLDDTDLIKYIEVSVDDTSFYNTYSECVVMIVKNTAGLASVLTIDTMGTTSSIEASGKKIYVRKSDNILEPINTSGSVDLNTPNLNNISPTGTIHMMGVPFIISVASSEDINLTTDSRFTSAYIVAVRNTSSSSINIYTTDLSAYDEDGSIYLNSDSPPYVTIDGGANVRTFIRILFSPTAFVPADTNYTPEDA